jgi:thiol-disulfide isomerase/thioredoxin
VAGESEATSYADLNLAGFGGNTLTAAELRGRPVLLQFWASWCGSCGSLMWDLDELTRGLPDVVYLAVSVDDDAAAPRAYLERHPLFGLHPRRFWFDTSAALKRSLAVEAVPLIVLLDASGRELLRHAGHMNSADLQRFRNLLTQQRTLGTTHEAQ